jgi:O-antigen biosynthesis protein WbqP
VNGIRPVAGLPSSGYAAKRLIDLILVSLVMIVAFIPGLLITLLVRLTSKGPALYWSERVGRRNRNFSMPKYRTMRIDTPVVATHLMHDPERYLTPPGKLLRMTSLDELPQLWSVLKGDMSLVGPRPALFNQDDLIALRTEAGVDNLLPGLTGWAQINGRDELPIPDKVRLDVEYLQRQSFLFDMKILLLTIGRVMRRHGVAH